MLKFSEAVWADLHERDPARTRELAIVDRERDAAEAALATADPSRLDDGQQRIRELSARREQLLLELRAAVAGQAPAAAPEAAPATATYTEMLQARIDAANKKAREATTEGEQREASDELIAAEKRLAAFRNPNQPGEITS